ncbi:MAG: hypothetical protein M3024_15725 [Candidatus Dormibacteraeota bacterium]|nr:hypothetical protein [Candidatus Dormibacteraeota bacterium]MDQ6920535.1 hypothetical protein [Candidatus Dormibacteraeota bacterium]
MPRVIHHRFHGLPAKRLDWLRSGFESMASVRDWRGDAPWVATDSSPGLFEMEFLRHVRSAEGDNVSAAGFIKTGGDETDALVLLLFLRDVSSELGARVTVRDEDNPLAKLRSLEFSGGRLPSGNTLEELLARRAVIKKVDGQAIMFYPPAHRLSTLTASRSAAWGYGLCGLRAYAPTLLEAESEALKIMRAMRHLGH